MDKVDKEDTQKYTYVQMTRGVTMAKKRLNIELSIEHYEALRKQASASGTTVSGVIRQLIEKSRDHLPIEVVKSYRSDPLYKRRGSFDGPRYLAEKHDQYLYGQPPK